MTAGMSKAIKKEIKKEKGGRGGGLVYEANRLGMDGSHS
jgi:hypothetical protein